jgi:hypothetical protein
MTEKEQVSKKGISADWLLRGALTRIGDTFDRLTGRRWVPSSSLATSELIEKLKALLESEKRTDDIGREYVPHNIKLKMQWDKFSSDSEESLRKLENEMLTAMVDFINDNRYYTYSPIHIEVKPDYFTKGVKLFLSFDEAEEEREADIHVSNAPAADTKSQEAGPAFSVRFAFTAAGKDVMKEIEFAPGVRVSVGRTKENGLAVDDPSVSKVHASMVLNAEGRLAIADTGSTNGTFVDGTRIAYGKAVVLEPGSKLMLGLVSVGLKFVERPAPAPVEDELPDTASYKVGEFEFTQRMERPAETNGAPAPEPAPTESAIDLGQAEADINK